MSHTMTTIIATPATEPITIPAIAPPLNPLDLLLSFPANHLSFLALQI